MRTKKWQVLLVGVLLVFVTSACSLGSQEQPEPTPTRTPLPTFTPTPEGRVANEQLWEVDTNQPEATNVVVVALPTDTPTPIPTATLIPDTPTPTSPPPTATPVPPSVVITRPTVNIRRGPGTNYGVLGQGRNGEKFIITGKNPRGDWWQIDFNGQAGWVKDDIVDKEGQLDTVQVVASIPAAPTPVPRPPTATPVPAQPTQPPAPQYPFSLGKGLETCSPNAGSTYFNGIVRDRSNNPVNGVCVHIAFYAPRNTKCSGCDGVGNGNWGFSPFGGPAPAGTTVEIFIVPCPSGGVPAGGQGSNFGDLTPQSEKWVHTINASEQCTGITFYKN